MVCVNNIATVVWLHVVHFLFSLTITSSPSCGDSGESKDIKFCHTYPADCHFVVAVITLLLIIDYNLGLSRTCTSRANEMCLCKCTHTTTVMLSAVYTHKNTHFFLHISHVLFWTLFWEVSPQLLAEKNYHNAQPNSNLTLSSSLSQWSH